MTSSLHHRPSTQAQWKIPPLTPWEACLLTSLLEELINAIWRTYGDDMADFQAMQGVETPRPKDAVWASSTDPDDPNDLDKDIPF